MFRTLLAATLALVCVVGPASADDSALYDPAPPPDSAFVRVIDASGRGELNPVVGDVPIAVPASGVSAYVAVPAGPAPVALSSEIGTVELAVGKYYTLALNEAGGEGPRLIEDKIGDNPAKSGVYVYNFSDAATVALYAPQPKANVIADLAPGASGFRAVNAITVDLAVVAGTQTIATFDQVALKRRGGMTFVVFGTGDGRTAVAVANQTAR